VDQVRPQRQSLKARVLFTSAGMNNSANGRHGMNRLPGQAAPVRAAVTASVV
jgi:hypothetical protein